MSGLKNIIRQLANEGSSASLLVGTVSAVDTETRTVDVEPINEDAPILGVNLQANQEAAVGVVLFPRKGSYVTVAMLSGYAAGVVVLTEDVESIEVNINDGTKLTITEDGISLNVKDGITLDIDDSAAVFNGGDLGGLIKIKELTDKLNAIEKDINKLKTVFSSWVPAPQDGGAALKGSVSSWASKQLTLSKRGDYEDETVKH